MSTVKRDYLVELQEKHENKLTEGETDDSMHYDDNLGLQFNDALLHVIDYMEVNNLEEIVLEDHMKNKEHPGQEFYFERVKEYLKNEVG